jgi:Carbohydrate esterase, sialic acid-specific acetylesterase
MRKGSSVAVALLMAGVGACGVKLHAPPDSMPAGEEGTGGTTPTVVEDASPPTGSGGSDNPPGGTGGRDSTGGKGGGGATGGGGGSGGATGGTGGSPLRPDAAAPSGATVMINGMAVPKEKAIVFIHIGHSDMCGRATGPSSLMPFFYNTDPHLWMYGKGGAWKPAKEPTACMEPGATRAGPGMAILRTALAHAPDSYFISIGHGHSGAENGYCPNFRRGGMFYGTFMDAAKELKGKVTFGGIYTMFGITEYHLGNAGLMTLGDCLAGIGNDIREDLGDPSIPLMVGDWNAGGTGIYSPTGQYGSIARPQIQMVPMKTTRAAVIPTNGLPMEDDRHLNMTGHKMWAERGYGLMKDMDWAPWATVP